MDISWYAKFERYVNFEFYKTYHLVLFTKYRFERYVNFEFYKTNKTAYKWFKMFERYVNFEFYKTLTHESKTAIGLRDM